MTKPQETLLLRVLLSVNGTLIAAGVVATISVAINLARVEERIEATNQRLGRIESAMGDRIWTSN